METIDITPTWSGIVNALIIVIQDGDSKGRQIAIEELRRMAEIADKYVESQKTPKK